MRMTHANSVAAVDRAAPVTGPRVSVVVVTWNVRDYTLGCLAALERHPPGVPFEVIVVDNASSDGTADAVAQAHPQVRLIRNRENVGFPRANNQALAVASGEYVLFLNPDTEVGPDAVAACVRALNADPSIGMSGCRLDYADGTVQLECARRPYLLRHLLIETLYLHMLFPTHPLFGHHLMGDWDHRGERDVEAICGAFMLVRREVARAIGGLPEDVFMYHEDLSFCLRLRRAGWRIRYLGDVATKHYWRQSSRRSGSRLVLLEGIYKLQLIREAQGAFMAAVARVVFALRCVLRLAVALPGMLLPARIRRRYPRLFDAGAHALQLIWAVAPWLVRGQVPRPTGAPA